MHIHSFSPSSMNAFGHSFTHTQWPTCYLRATLTKASALPSSCCPILGRLAHPPQPQDPTLPASVPTAAPPRVGAGRPTEGSAHTQDALRPHVPNGATKGCSALTPSPPVFHARKGNQELLAASLVLRKAAGLGRRGCSPSKPSYNGGRKKWRLGSWV